MNALASPRRLFSEPALIIGFALVILLSTGTSLLALMQIDTLQRELQNLSERRLDKIGWIGQMRRSTREGTVRLQNMLLLADPAARAQEWRYLRELAVELIQARELLVAQALTDQERSILLQQSALARITEPLRQRIAELALEGRSAEAHRLLIESLIPAQDRMLLELERLAEMQHVAFESESTAALARHAQRRQSMVALAVLALVVGFMIAYVIIRRSGQAEASLQAEKERVLVTLYSIGEAVITTDRDGQIDILNAVAERLTGYTADSARGRPFAEVVELRHGDSQQPANELAERALVSGCVVRANGDLVLVTPRGEQRAVELTSSPIRDPQGRINGAVHVLGDVTALRAMGRELVYHATHDSLTGLLNRRELENRLQTAIERSGKGRLEHALLYVDLDLFQVVNDTAGHIAGDELLKEIAGLLTSQARSSDCIARMGGDEFAILLEACPAQEAVLAAKALRNRIQALRFEWNGRRFEVGASIGVVPIGAGSGSISEVLRAADLACYVAKDSGRNRVHLFEPDDAALVHREGEMQRMHEVRDALANGSFTLFQQMIEPIGAGEDSRLMSEILLRMRAPSGELVEPQAFLPAAEHYQLGPMVDRWVIAETLQSVRLLRERPDLQDAVFSINISGQSLDDAGFIDFVLGALRDSGAPPEAICFEITETAAIGHMSRARELVSALKTIGCLFALDDFGSGSSSFAYLKQLPVDFLKIDGQFVRDIARDATDLALVESINQIGHVMGIKTIAEYVEDEQVKRLLEQIGVDFAQGEAIARPAPLALLFDGDSTVGVRPQLIGV